MPGRTRSALVAALCIFPLVYLAADTRLASARSKNNTMGQDVLEYDKDPASGVIRCGLTVEIKSTSLCKGGPGTVTAHACGGGGPRTAVCH